VPLDITPEPTVEEREAIETALRTLLAGNSLPPAYASAWRKAALREAIEDQAVARPRKSRGATRA
jgi:hypothetical protein